MSSKRKKNINDGYRAKKILALLKEDIPYTGSGKNTLKGKDKMKEASAKPNFNILEEDIITPSTSSGRVTINSNTELIQGKVENLRRSSLRSAKMRNEAKEKSQVSPYKLSKRSKSAKHQTSSTFAKCNKTECSSDDSVIENSPDCSLASMATLSKSIVNPHLYKPPDEMFPDNFMKSLLIDEYNLIKKVAKSVPRKNAKCVSLSDLTVDTSTNSKNIKRHNSAESVPFEVSSVMIMPITRKPGFNTNENEGNFPGYLKQNCDDAVFDFIPESTVRPSDFAFTKARSLSDLTHDIRKEYLRRCTSTLPMETFSGLDTHNVGRTIFDSKMRSDIENDCQPLGVMSNESFDRSFTIIVPTSSINDPLNEDINIPSDDILRNSIFHDNSLKSLPIYEYNLLKKVSKSCKNIISRVKCVSLSDLTVDTSTDLKDIRRYNSAKSVPFEVSSGKIMPSTRKPSVDEYVLRKQGFRSCRKKVLYLNQDNDDGIDCTPESRVTPSDFALMKVRSLSLSDLTHDITKECHRRCTSTLPMETFSGLDTHNNIDHEMLELEDQLVNDDEYLPSSEILNESSDSSTAKHCSEDEYTYGNLNGNKKRRKKSKPAEWKKNKAKEMRMKGKEYLGYRRPRGEKPKQDRIRPARQLGEACKSEFCNKSKFRGCSEISEENRKQIHSNFWKNLNWDQRKIYVSSLVQRSTPNRKTVKNGNSRRTGTLQYFLPRESNSDVKVQVCREMFLSTLSLGTFTVQQWVKNAEFGMVPNQDVINTSRKRTINEETDLKLQYLDKFFNTIPKLPSHYARKETTKLYLEPIFQSLRGLYRAYKSYCTQENVPFVCRYTFEIKFHEKNLSFHTLKKDKCDNCCEYEAGNLNEADYQVHIIKKNRARKEKSDDKKKADKKEVIVLTMDLESVKSCPFLTASALYFKTKLVCHNFTLYNLGDRHCTCYWFDETAADLTASTFASCLVDYLERHCLPLKLPIIIFSDGCTYQNRNTVMANALLGLSNKHGVMITQKYLEPGHTQMECDSVHSNIEQKLKNREIHLPSDYATVTKEIRKNQPYEVVQINHEFVKDFANPKTWTYKSIRPGRKAGDPQVVDIRAICYNPDFTIQVKLDFDSEWMDLPQKSFAVRQTHYDRLHARPIPIKSSKYNHLQQLKPVLPSDCHLFYDNLPHNDKD